MNPLSNLIHNDLLHIYKQFVANILSIHYFFNMKSLQSYCTPLCTHCTPATCCLLNSFVLTGWIMQINLHCIWRKGHIALRHFCVFSKNCHICDLETLLCSYRGCQRDGCPSWTWWKPNQCVFLRLYFSLINRTARSCHMWVESTLSFTSVYPLPSLTTFLSLAALCRQTALFGESLCPRQWSRV